MNVLEIIYLVAEIDFQPKLFIPVKNKWGSKFLSFGNQKELTIRIQTKLKNLSKKNFDTRKLILVTTVFYIDMRIYSIDRLLNGSQIVRMLFYSSKSKHICKLNYMQNYAIQGEPGDAGPRGYPG